MYTKINLSSALIAELFNQIDAGKSRVSESKSKGLKSKCQTQFAYDVFCPMYEINFTVLITFLSHGVAFAYCSCGLPEDKRCSHIEEALLFHQERSRCELERFFGEDAIAEVAVF